MVKQARQALDRLLPMDKLLDWVDVEIERGADDPSISRGLLRILFVSALLVSIGFMMFILAVLAIIAAVWAVTG